MDLFDLYARISLDTDRYESALSDAVKTAGDFGGKLKNSLESAAKKCESALSGVAKTASSFGDKIKSSFESVANSVSKLGDKLKTGLAAAGKAAATGIAAVTGAATAASGALLALEGSTEEYRVAQGKLNTAFEAAGYNTAVAQQAYEGFYKILGETDTATEASQLLASLANNAEDMSTWIDIAAGVNGTFGDSLPIEGLIESANETAKVGQVTGVLADALNWGALAGETFGIAMKDATEENEDWNKAVMKAASTEDYFNLALNQCANEAERNQLIMNTLSKAYQGAADSFYKNNEALIKTRENQAKLDKSLAGLGNTVSNIKAKVVSDFIPSIVSMADAVNNMLLGTEGAGEQLSQAITGFIQKIIEKLPDFLNMGIQIIKAIATGIMGAIPTLIELIPQLIKNLVDGFIKYAPQILQMGVDIILSIIAGLQEALPVLIEAIPKIVSDIVKIINDNLPMILDVIRQVLTALIEVFKEVFPMLLQIGLEIITTIISGIIQALPSIISTATEIILTFIEWLTSPENLQMIIDAGLMLLKGLADGFLAALPVIIEKVPVIIGNIIDVFMSVLPQIINVGLEIVSTIILGIAQALPEFIPAAVEVVLKLAESLTTPENIQTIIQAGFALLKGLADGIIAAIPIIVEKVPIIIQNIVDGFMSAAPQIIDVGKEYITNIITGIGEALPKMIPAAIEIVLKFIEWLTTPENIKSIIQAALVLIKGLVDGLIAAIPIISEKVPVIVGNIIEGFLSAVPDMIKVGIDLIAGLISGLVESVSKTPQIIADIVTSIVNGFKNLFGIHSPSTVFAEMGINLILGLLQGLTENFKKVIDFFGEAKNAMKEKWEDLKDFFKSIWDGVKDVFADVKETFLDIGGNVVDGIKDGVFQGWSDLTGWINEKVSGLVDSVKNKLGIHSPSRVFKAIGEFMAEGLGIGWGDEYSSVKKEIENGLDFSTNSATMSLNSANSSSIINKGSTGDTFIFNSPKALDPVSAAREMKKAKQQMALGLI